MEDALGIDINTERGQAFIVSAYRKLGASALTEEAQSFVHQALRDEREEERRVRREWSNY